MVCYAERKTRPAGVSDNMESQSEDRTRQLSRRLAFVGDINLGRGVDALIPGRQAEDFWGDTLPVLRGADAVFANLECPVSARGRPWRRTPKSFRYRARPEAISLLKAANIRFVCLANNHMLDYEDEALRDTLTHLDEAGIAHAGAGENHDQAMQPAVVDLDGYRVGLFGLTDTVRSFAARHDRAGTNYLRISERESALSRVRRQIEATRALDPDLIVLSAHWGPNLRPFPPPRFKAFARAAAALGVDLFHGHSAHLFQGIEFVGEATILYDTGNFLDDYWVFPGIRTDWSFIFVAEYEGPSLTALELVPICIDNCAARLATESESERIFGQMVRRCRAFGTLARPEGGRLRIEVPSSAPFGGAKETGNRVPTAA